MTKKPCPKCNKEFTSKNFARHVRTCKGPIIDGKRKCPHCNEWVSRLKRHISRKHPTLESDSLREENKALLEELVKHKEELAEKTKKIHELEMQIVAKPATYNHNNNNCLILQANLTPISLHPSDPGYEECKADFIGRLQNKLGDGKHSASTYSFICRCTGVDFLFGGEKARYMTTDLARKKGVYLAPDGRLRYDHKHEKVSSFYGNCLHNKLTDSVVSPCYYNRVMLDSPKYFSKRVTSDGYSSYKKICE